MFRTVRLSIIRTLFTAVPSWSCSKAVYKSVWHIPLLSVQWINSWWWTEELSETCRVSWQNKFVKLVHLVGFITNKSGGVVSSARRRMFTSVHVFPHFSSETTESICMLSDMQVTPMEATPSSKFRFPTFCDNHVLGTLLLGWRCH